MVHSLCTVERPWASAYSAWAWSRSTARRADGRGNRPRSIVRLWLLIVTASALAAGLGYALLDGAPNAVFSVIQAFAAGAVLQMLVTTMLPEALEDSGPAVGLVTVLGFTLSFYLSVG